jgi:hypothetical protein
MLRRTYGCSDMIMLTAAGSVVDQFDENKTVLVAEDASWADPFSENYQKEIDKALVERLGVHPRQKLKEATATVNKLKKQAVTDLSVVKTQMERKFISDKVRLALLEDQFGYSKCWKKARGNNSSLVELLFSFQNNLSDELKLEFTKKGVSAVRIESILANATILNKAGITQETLKGSAQVQNDEAIDEFNNIYNTAMDICKVAQRVFVNDKTRKKLFTFSYLVRMQISAGVDNEKDTKTTTSSADTKPTT